jgi:hypothetical protein
MKSKMGETIRVSDRFGIKKISKDDSEYYDKSGPRGAPPIKILSNVHLQLKNPKNGRIVAQRWSHNIFLNYGRDWLAHLIGYNTGYMKFREDGIRYIAFGIGGTSQLIPSDDIRETYAGYPDKWNEGTGGSGDPSQVDTDPTVIALEWPVEITSGVYYDNIVAPVTFPETGIVRFTNILGINEISFGSYTSVPLSEMALVVNNLTDLTDPPVVATGLPIEKYVVAYNTFDTLSKTNSYVLQVDWEIRFS